MELRSPLNLLTKAPAYQGGLGKIQSPIASLTKGGGEAGGINDLAQTRTLKVMTPNELQQSNIPELLAEILATGEPIQIDWDGKLFEIVSVEQKSKLDNLVPHPEVYIGDPEDLVNISWEHELNLDLPS